MTKIVQREDARLFHTDTGRTVTVTRTDDTAPPWVEAEPHVEAFFYATPDWTDPTPLDEIESALAAAYVNFRLMEIPMHAAYRAVVYTPGEVTRLATVFTNPSGWEILFSTRPGHVMSVSEFKTFLADVGHYLRGEVWNVNGEVVYAPTADDAAIRYLDSNP